MHLQHSVALKCWFFKANHDARNVADECLGKLEEKALIQFFWIAPIMLELKVLYTAF
jgi:hypothetical protein